MGRAQWAQSMPDWRTVGVMCGLDMGRGDVAACVGSGLPWECGWWVEGMFEYCSGSSKLLTAMVGGSMLIDGITGADDSLEDSVCSNSSGKTIVGIVGESGKLIDGTGCLSAGSTLIRGISTTGDFEAPGSANTLDAPSG